MAEPIKTEFEWNDLNDTNLIYPCDYCEAIGYYSCCDDGATSSACNHCAFNILFSIMKDTIEKKGVLL